MLTSCGIDGSWHCVKIKAVGTITDEQCREKYGFGIGMDLYFNSNGTGTYRDGVKEINFDWKKLDNKNDSYELDFDESIFGYNGGSRYIIEFFNGNIILKHPKDDGYGTWHRYYFESGTSDNVGKTLATFEREEWGKGYNPDKSSYIYY